MIGINNAKFGIQLRKVQRFEFGILKILFSWLNCSDWHLNGIPSKIKSKDMAWTCFIEVFGIIRRMY